MNTHPTLNRQLRSIPRRAEQNQDRLLAETFADSGVTNELDTVDHQILYGRRGTGKTHAFKYFASEKRSGGDVALYIDLRTIASPMTVSAQDRKPAIERALFTFSDLMVAVRDGLYDEITSDNSLFDDPALTSAVDRLSSAISQVRVTGSVERVYELETGVDKRKASSAEASFSTKGVGAGFSHRRSKGEKDTERWTTTESGSELPSVSLRAVHQALQEVGRSLNERRVWILLDEWSSVHLELQPFLADFIAHSLFPATNITVKFAAIRQNARFYHLDDGQSIGIETGADTSGSISLDDFMVFEGNEELSRSFFRELFFKHISVQMSKDLTGLPTIAGAEDVIRLGFADRRAFDELVRAAEGVPRDAVNIAAKAASRARDRKVTVPDVRFAARSWYQDDKLQNLSGDNRSLSLLTWISEHTIKKRKARAFLVSEDQAGDDLLSDLFNRRVLHVVRRGYSAQDVPGVRYQVWVIDYGAYVDLLHTKFKAESEKQLTMLLDGTDVVEDCDLQEVDKFERLEVPHQDLRAIRRAILDVSEFYREGQE